MVALNPNESPASRSIKRVLVLNYSQTGQLAEVTRRIVEPLQQDSGISVHIETLRPLAPYPFPWGFFSFLDAFPESAHMVPPALQALSLKGDEDFDLVILPYQVWFLAPSLPVTAFLKHPLAKLLLAGKPVVTVIACRNMWMQAQEKMKGMLQDCGARLLDNVALVDPSPTMASLWTTPFWLLSGKKDFLKFLPPAGVDAASIAAARRFGLALRDALHKNEERGMAPLLSGLKAVNSNPHLLFSEKAATRSFFVWGKLLRAVGGPGQWRRYPFLILYVIFLITLISTVVPVSLLIQSLTRPLMRRRFAAMKQQFDLPSGSGAERMHLYEH
ncbi:MAG: dialkylresorcinol condensing enzyme [Nitrosomonadales bacterium]|nr:dialkylresorcinol condensing enzyme [Nitrosomonadales bacterium]